MTDVCPTCRSEFEPMNGNQRYCTPSCRRKRTNAKQSAPQLPASELAYLRKLVNFTPRQK
jgi:hypothetical protein